MTLKELVNKYHSNRANYIKANFNETQLRSEFLDPLFGLLGWDIKNEAGKSTNEREVLLEEALKANASANTKKPDYTFRLYSERKFFVEAKKPSVKIENDVDSAKQVRRYGFTAKLKISVLSNFEYLIIFDTSHKVEPQDAFQKALINKFHYTEFEARFDEITNLLGRDNVYNGNFDATWSNIETQINHYSIDDHFLNQINQWRLLLGTEIYNYDNTISEQSLNDTVQSYINRILFLRVCEDRNIEQYQTLLKFASSSDFKALIKKFEDADKYYNSGVFDQLLSNAIIKNVSSVFWTIITQLYYPESPYSFAVFASDILGNIYEIFLSEKLIIQNHTIALVKKPENTDKDIVTTPTYIINYILRETINKKCFGKTDAEILSMKFADIACGSGAFLLELYQILNDTFIDYYLKNNSKVLIQTNINTYKLPLEIKTKILLNCIYGVDKDFNAVEASKFGLLLKILENEDTSTINITKPILPSLDENIYFGNSLLETKNVKQKSDRAIINPFDFTKLKFDVIVGNPPYMKSEDMKNFTPLELPLYKDLYRTAHKQFDKYFLFIERGITLLKNEGLLSFIVPSKFTKVGAAKELREVLKSNEHILTLQSFGANQVFSKKTTYTSLLFLSKTKQKDFYYSEVKNLKEWKLRDYSNLIIDKIPTVSLNSEIWFLIPPQLKSAYDGILKQSLPLSEIVSLKNINNGIQTSANDVFVLKPTKITSKHLFFEKDKVEWKIEVNATRPYYETVRGNAGDKLYTYRTLMPNSFVIYPYIVKKAKANFIIEKDFKEKFPLAYKYLLSYKKRLLERDIKPTPKTNNEWYRYGRSQYLELGEIKEKIFVGVMSLGEKYPIDFSKTLHTAGGTAGYCSIYLSASCPYSIYYIQAILNSRYVEWISSLRGEVFRGGYIARGTKLLKDLPIRTIDFTSEVDAEMHSNIVNLQKDLIDLQSQIDANQNNKRNLTPLLRSFNELTEEMERALKELYNLGNNELLIPQIEEMYETD
jgi:hypothetical protein